MTTDDDTVKSAHVVEVSDEVLRDPLLGKTLAGQFQILDVLGNGGMSTVYRAEDLLLHRIVAIKTLLPSLVAKQSTLGRFQREARAVATLKHANIGTVFSAGVTDDGTPFLVMDLIPGTPLTAVLQENRTFDIKSALNLFIQLADALDHAHQKGVVHRDLKPSNVILTASTKTVESSEIANSELQNYHATIIDFGIAKVVSPEYKEAIDLTMTGEVFGSPKYMSPEQCRAQEVDTRCDVYSLGCLMYETLTGRAPFLADSVFEVMAKHLSEEPLPFDALPPGGPINKGDIPLALEILVLNCLAKDREKRPRSMGEITSILTRIRNGSLVRAHQDEDFDLRVPDTLPMAIPWQGDWLSSDRPLAVDVNDIATLTSIGTAIDTNDGQPTSEQIEIVRSIALRILPAEEHDSLEKTFKSLTKIGKLSASPNFRLHRQVTVLDTIADLLLLSKALQHSEKFYRSLIEIIPEPRHPEFVIKKAEIWLKLADSLYCQKTKTFDAMTLYSAHLYYWKTHAGDTDVPMALRQSRFADCLLMDESYKVAETAYEDLIDLWTTLENPCNASLAALKKAYVVLRRRTVVEKPSELLKSVETIGGAYGQDSPYYATARRLYKGLLQEAGLS